MTRCTHHISMWPHPLRSQRNWIVKQWKNLINTWCAKFSPNESVPKFINDKRWRVIRYKYALFSWWKQLWRQKQNYAKAPVSKEVRNICVTEIRSCSTAYSMRNHSQSQDPAALQGAAVHWSYRSPCRGKDRTCSSRLSDEATRVGQQPGADRSNPRARAHTETWNFIAFLLKQCSLCLLVK